ncbi:hypothetical protein ACTXT7_011633 [Hymenolepis weldensis]
MPDLLAVCESGILPDPFKCESITVRFENRCPQGFIFAWELDKAELISPAWAHEVDISIFNVKLFENRILLESSPEALDAEGRR